MNKNETRYLITDIVSIGVIRIAKKGEAYRQATVAGWGVVEWYSPVNDYKAPVNRDKSDKTQVMYCGEDDSATLYPKYGREFVIGAYGEINLKDAPTQAETEVILQSDSCGFSFWAKDTSDLKIFVTYDENGLIDTYRLDNWAGKPYDGEVEIKFEDLQSEEDHDRIDRTDIVGTLEHDRKTN